MGIKLKSLYEKIAAGFALAAILVLTVALFAGALRHEFVWDDIPIIFHKTGVTYPFPADIRQIFSPVQGMLYKPLTLLTFMVEYDFFKSNPFVAHLDNLILHLLNILLAFGLVLAWSKRKSVALLCGLFFAIHPLHVEPVAWAIGRKDLLSTFFLFVSLLAYQRYIEKGNRWWYVTVFVGTVAGVLAKPVVGVMPFFMLLMDYRARRPLRWAVIVEKIPFGFLGVIIGGLAIYTQYDQIYVNAPLFPRILVSFRQLVFYLGKALWPVNLCAVYPYPDRIGLNLPEYWFCMLVITGLAIGIFCLKNREVLFGVLFFYLPVIATLARSGEAGYMAADRYVYASLLGLLYVFFQGVGWLYEKHLPFDAMKKAGLILAVSVLTAFFAKQTYANLPKWENDFTLFSDVSLKAPEHYLAYNNIGNTYMFVRGEFEKSEKFYSRSVQLNPYFLKSRLNLARAYAKRGKWDQAFEMCRQASMLWPKIPAIYDLWGRIYWEKGDFENALKKFRQGIDAEPCYSELYSDIAMVYNLKTQLDGSLTQFRAKRQILQTPILNPGNTGAANS